MREREETEGLEKDGQEGIREASRRLEGRHCVHFYSRLKRDQASGIRSRAEEVRGDSQESAREDESCKTYFADAEDVTDERPVSEM